MSSSATYPKRPYPMTPVSRMLKLGGRVSFVVPAPRGTVMPGAKDFLWMGLQFAQALICAKLRLA